MLEMVAKQERRVSPRSVEEQRWHRPVPLLVLGRQLYRE